MEKRIDFEPKLIGTTMEERTMKMIDVNKQRISDMFFGIVMDMEEEFGDLEYPTGESKLFCDVQVVYFMPCGACGNVFYTPPIKVEDERELLTCPFCGYDHLEEIY